jgi:hypothetical protein
MANRWIEHVREFAKRNNTTYACAISTPECKEEYRKKYGSRKKLTQKQEREKMGAEDRPAPAPAKKERPKPAPELKERWAMTSEDILSKKMNEEEKKRLVEISRMMGEDFNVAKKPENIQMEMVEIPTKKSRGRPKKYSSAEEARKAKYEQTTASKKKTAERQKKLLEEARARLKEQALMAAADYPAPKEEKKTPKKSAAQKVFEIPELKREIQSYERTLTKKARDKLVEDITNDVDYWGSLLSVFDTDFPRYKNEKQKKSIEKKADKYHTLIYEMKGLLIERLNFLALKNKLKSVDEGDTYYDDLTYYDYNRVDIDSDGNVGKDALTDIRDVVLDNAFTNYKSLMKEMSVSEKDAVVILNKRLKKKDRFKDTEFVVPE